jgi:SAM-dependent methyltransferase
MGEGVGSMRDRLEDLYDSWSEKAPELIDHDIKIGSRKADLILSHTPAPLLSDVKSVLDFGCGYGVVLRRFADALSADMAIGVDYSASAVQVASDRFSTPSVRYAVAPTLDAGELGGFLATLAPDGVDCILLVDLLEHVPDCRALMSVLSRSGGLFVIKLPVENSIFDNYVRRKEYPSSAHSNGHLREFTVNDVHYFVRQLGLTPLHEEVYVYRLGEMFPPPPARPGPMRRLKRGIHITFWLLSRALLPRRVFLRLVGGGGYFCLATYNPANVLDP